MPPSVYRKALGQHHLVSGALTRPLVDFLRPAGERVVEIGPGGGVLTAELLAAGARRVVAWELDLTWAAAARRSLAGLPGAGRLTLVAGDALTLAWRRLPAPTLVAGNLPYNVATRLITNLVPHHATVPRAAFLVQKEVAERLTATPGGGAYGYLTVLVHCYAEVTWLGRVKRGSFRPPPKVEGAFAGLTLKPPPLPAAEMSGFLELVSRAFSQRRKTLKNALGAGGHRERAEAALTTAGISQGTRAEELGVEEFLEVYRRWSS